MDRAYQNLFSGSCISSPTCTLNQLCLRIWNAIVWWYGMIWSHLTSDSLCFLRLKVGDQNRFLGLGPMEFHILIKAMLIAIKHLWRSSLQSGETLRVIRSSPNPYIFPWQLFPTMRRPNKIKQNTILTYLQKFLALNQSQSSNLCQGSRQLSKKLSLCIL